MFKRNINSKPRKKGQSTVEYVILVAAVLTAILLFLGPGGVFQRQLNDSMSQGTDAMSNMAGRLEGAVAPAV